MGIHGFGYVLLLAFRNGFVLQNLCIGTGVSLDMEDSDQPHSTPTPLMV